MIANDYVGVAHQNDAPNKLCACASFFRCIIDLNHIPIDISIGLELDREHRERC